MAALFVQLSCSCSFLFTKDDAACYVVLPECLVLIQFYKAVQTLLNVAIVRTFHAFSELQPICCKVCMRLEASAVFLPVVTHHRFLHLPFRTSMSCLHDRRVSGGRAFFVLLVAPVFCCRDSLMSSLLLVL